MVVSIDPSKIDPKIKYVREHENVSISCLAQKVHNWSFNGGGLPQNVITDNNKLLIINIKRLNQGKYYCTVGRRSKIIFISRSTIYVYGKKKRISNILLRLYLDKYPSTFQYKQYFILVKTGLLS